MKLCLILNSSPVSENHHQAARHVESTTAAHSTASASRFWRRSMLLDHKPQPCPGCLRATILGAKLKQDEAGKMFTGAASSPYGSPQLFVPRLRQGVLAAPEALEISAPCTHCQHHNTINS